MIKEIQTNKIKSSFGQIVGPFKETAGFHKDKKRNLNVAIGNYYYKDQFVLKKKLKPTCLVL